MAPAKAQGGSAGEVQDRALKAAETDATKRALATFGRAFGLALYAGGTRQAPRPLRKDALHAQARRQRRRTRRHRPIRLRTPMHRPPSVRKAKPANGDR